MKRNGDMSVPSNPQQSAGVEPSRWIPVSERLPSFTDHAEGSARSWECEITCIVATEYNSVLCMEWTRNRYAKTEAGKAPRWKWRGMNSPWAVTDWMPLPAPPDATKAEVSVRSQDNVELK